MSSRFSIRSMLIFVAVAALVCVSFTNATHFVASIVYTVTVIVLLAAVVGAIYRKGGARAFWVGVAIFGWGAFALIFTEIAMTRTEFVTPTLMKRLFEVVHPNVGYDDPITGRRVDPNVSTFVNLGYAYTVLLLALIGGALSRWCFATRHQDA